MARYEKTLYPATAQPFASSTGYPKSGLFAMHITYPDTAYDDDVTDWEYGTNASSNWKQGLTVVVRTPIAHEALPTEATNVIGVDLKAAAAAATAGGLSLTYDLGTEEATRLIAAKINSRKAKQVSERGLTRLLRARYVRMSGRETITGSSFGGLDTNTMTVSLNIPYQHGYPSDLPKQGRIVVVGGTAAGTYNYTDLSLRFLGNTLAFVKLTIASHGIPVGSTGATSVTFDAEPPKHTVVLSWEKNAPSSDAGYWSGANLGPIIQGIGTTVPQWKMLAKPMDGGNMALPAVNAVSRSGKSADVDGAATSGFSRFSIEGLNSCITPNIPPPDYNITAPTVEGVLTAATTQPTTTGDLNIETLEYGSNFFGESDTVGISLENGYTSALSADVNNMMPARDSTTISSVSHTADTLNYGINDDNVQTYSRPFRTTNTVNSERVKGLVISNEELVFEDLPVVDDQGNELILKGGSPFGTVIRDFKLQNAREIDDENIVGPSSPNDTFSPNLQIQLPDETQIPGEIFVRSGHDRVQAWSNLSWGMGGLSPPDPRKAGVAEASNEASQFDTHDRMLIFHCKRILHPSMSLTGIDSNITAGSQPSGTTRFFTAHKISDHTERGSVLKQTNNGTATGELYPHHRIRFGRQGHSFVSPIGHRGTPMNLRRQLHRSFGSSYSLMFETKSEHKHFGFGSGASTNSTTRYDLDTLDLKGTSGYDEATGSFSSDGLPQEEIGGSRLDNHKRNYSSTTPRKNVDYLIAPGQEHAKVEGSNQSVSQATVSTTTISGVATPTHLTLTDALTFNNRGNVANEFMVNGFLVGDCTLFGGRPQPNIITSDAGNLYVSGSPHGSIAVRSATELATVPPLLLHDPEMLNASATPIRVGLNYVVTGSLDMGLLKESDTNTGCVPDAFLCSWLAEYGHPAFFGTNREHFMTFRYREAGMPRSTNYPATRQILLRNYSPNTTAGQAVNAQAFERLYAVQWLQNQGFNGLNAGGHGNVKGLRSAGAVLMGHTTIREPAGTMRIIKPTSGSERLTRGEGIGDGIDPLQEGSRLTVDTDSDGEATTKFYFLMDSRTTVNYSRHLPIRAWGTRTASDALDMLAGDPTENQNAQKIEGKGRFDGGIHDSMNLIPDATAYGADWNMPANYAGIERNLPVGIVMSGHTTEATPFFGLRRLSNTPVLSHEEQIGIGRRLNLTEFGMLSPMAHASGHWDVSVDDIRSETLPVSSPVLWLKADSLNLNDGDAISEWVDSSDNGFVFSQSTASAQPTFIKSSSYVNDMPVVDCDGNDKLFTPFSEKLNTAEITAFVVAWADSDDNAIHGIIESRASSPVTRSGFNLYIRMDSNNQWQWWAGSDTTWTTVSSATNSAVGGQPELVTASITGGDGAGSSATATLDLKGAGNYTATGNFWKADNGEYTVGNVPTSFFLNGKIAEVIQYDRGLTTDEKRAVEGYLARKYGFTLVSPHPYAINESLDMIPKNKGLDPHIDLVQFKGSTSYPQSESPMALAKSSGDFGASADFFTLKGNALKTNAASVHYSTANDHYPVTGWGIGSESSGTVQSVAPIPLSEISEQRHLQSKGQPRLGLVMEVESERKDAKNTEYQVLSTKAVSLNTDLGIGQIYPVLPSWSMNTQFTTKAFTTTGGSVSHTVVNIDQKPVWSPDTNATKGAITVSGDSVRVDAMTHGKDVWTVRGAGDLPAWGGVFILRKSYLNRAEEGGRGSDIPASGTIAQASIPKRRYVDYAVRLVRPLKMYGFASNLMQDGWLLGARCSTSNSGGLGFQPFTRDKRYGVFEINADRALNQVDLISSANGAFEIEWPDANEHDVVWHLIPTSNMLQHFKSDAVRKNDGEIVSDIDARFSQITHAGGDEKLYQSESRYAADGTGVGGDFAKQTDEGEYRQSSTMLDAIPAVRIIRNLSVGLLAERRLDLPASGKLMAVGVVGYITYTSIDGYVLKGISHAGSTASIDFDSGVDLYLTDSTDTTTARTLRDAISHTPANVTAPSFIDNSVVLSKVQNNTWRRYDSSTDAVAKTTVNFKGLLPYDPTDFIMVNQSPFILFDGSSQGLVKAYNRSFIQIDGQNLSASFFPPYLFDSAGHLWRVSEIKEKQNKRFAVFRNTEGELLSQSGFELGNVIAGQYGAIGLRTSDVALQLLDKSAGSLAGFMAMPSSSITQNTFKTLNTLDAHPALHLMNQHSKTYVSRPTRGLNVMEVIKSLTEVDGRQLVVEKNGVMVYSEKAFNETENRIGSDSGAQLVRVSRMFDSPNQVIIIGDQVAENETVKVVVKDLERMRQAAGSNAEDNLVRTLQKEVPGLKTMKEALTVAKALLSRAENGAPLVSIEGLLKATSVNPGDIIEIDLPIHGVKGRFAVFEASHSYTKATSNLIVAQYEKGIEGLLSDIQAATSNPTRQSESQKKNELNELALNGSVRVIAVVKRYVRHNNSQHFIIGAKHGGGLGQIGTRDSNKRGKPIGQSKSRFFEVK